MEDLRHQTKLCSGETSANEVNLVRGRCWSIRASPYLVCGPPLVPIRLTPVWSLVPLVRPGFIILDLYSLIKSLWLEKTSRLSPPKLNPIYVLYIRVPRHGRPNEHCAHHSAAVNQ
jgi:hypothetical protein